ncbi:uncharacterized protein LOC128953686 [Oppia nitens]|uniref:uncharacterized protein LOC128953686 n=1 Tax=Oppia nitens TaxID=1686743 RepID=UPI0023DA6671|nr:uncharacterized protein LOC128953686 [Oppia nitens]
MSDNFNQMIDLMKQLDQKIIHLNDLEVDSLRRQLREDKNHLTNGLFEELLTSDLFKSKISQIIQNEDLIKLYFDRFLVSDGNTDHQMDNYFLRTNESCQQMLAELLTSMATMETTAANNLSSEPVVDIKHCTNLLAKVLRDFQTISSKSMAENDIKMFDSKQVMNKYVNKDFMTFDAFN